MHAFILVNAISISIEVVGILSLYRGDKGLNRLTVKFPRQDRAPCSKTYVYFVKTETVLYFMLYITTPVAPVTPQESMRAGN